MQRVATPPRVDLDEILIAQPSDQTQPDSTRRPIRQRTLEHFYSLDDTVAVSQHSSSSQGRGVDAAAGQPRADTPVLGLLRECPGNQEGSASPLLRVPGVVFDHWWSAAASERVHHCHTKAAGITLVNTVQDSCLSLRPLLTQRHHPCWQLCSTRQDGPR